MAKKIEQKLEELQNQVNDLRQEILGKNFDEMKKKIAKLDEINSLLRQITIKVKSAGYYIDDRGEKKLKVSYYIPNIILDIDEDYNIKRNEMFRALNLLNLVDDEGLNTIQKEINKINIDKKKNLH